jgi:autotransporter translocation and assembly factor TamB
MDLGLFEAFTRNLRRMRGTMDMDVTVGGSWETPRLGGTVAIRDGGATVPSLGVRYGPVNGRFSLSADSIRVDSLRINGERGRGRHRACALGRLPGRSSSWTCGP